LLKTGEDTRNPFHHVAVSGHPVVANIQVPSGVNWNRYRVAIRRLCRDPRWGVPRTPVIGTGMGGACGQLQSSAPQTGRHEGSRCYPSDECSFHVAGPFSPGPCPVSVRWRRPRFIGNIPYFSVQCRWTPPALLPIPTPCVSQLNSDERLESKELRRLRRDRLCAGECQLEVSQKMP